MNSVRKAAMRLACYIATIEGARPVIKSNTYRKQCAELRNQYQSFSAEQREQARLEGRRLIREMGLERAAGHLVPVLPSAPRGNGKYRRKYQAYLSRMEQWGKVTPLCPVCRMFWGGFPKRSWTREQAEQVLLRQKGEKISIYPCPHQPGFFHLGH